MINSAITICSLIVAKNEKGEWKNFLVLKSKEKVKILSLSLEGYTNISTPFGDLRYIGASK